MSEWLNPNSIDKHAARALGLSYGDDVEFQARMQRLTGNLHASIAVRLVILIALQLLNALTSSGVMGLVSYGLTFTIWAVFSLSRWAMIRDARRLAVIAHLMMNRSH